MDLNSEDHVHGPNGEHLPGGDYSPQPVPMGVAVQMVPLVDGSDDRIMVRYSSVNGEWFVFYDRQGAIDHASLLLRMAHQPSVTPTSPATPVEEISLPAAEDGEDSK